MHATSGNATRLCRLGIVLLVGLWWVAVRPPTLAAATSSSCIIDAFCDRMEGENCDNCSQDCDCICGDDLCTGTWPELETWGSCPEDCWDQCVCGDSICQTPAEYGGLGSGNEPECDPEDPEAECTYCETDCGGCEPEACYPQVCGEEFAQCRPCADNGECPGGEYCTFFGECAEIPEVECEGESQNFCSNLFGQGWVCDTQENPPICKPQTL